MNPADPFGRAAIAVAAALPERSGDAAGVLAQMPFLADYRAIDQAEPPPSVPPDHPLARLALAGLPPFEIELLIAIGLVEEDPRMAMLLGVGGDRPVFGQIEALFAACGTARAGLLHLLETGLLRCSDTGVPRALWPLAVPVPVWDALSGATLAPGSFAHTARADLLPLEAYLAPECHAKELRALPGRLETGALLAIRGPVGNGRATLAGCLARELGFGLLRLAPETLADADGWRQAGALATMLGAMPLIALDLAPGEERVLPAQPLWHGPVGVTLGRSGAVTSPGRTVSVSLIRPDPATRFAHWRAALPLAVEADLRPLAEAIRATGGAIRRAARGLTEAPPPAAVQALLRAHAAPKLETVAERLEAPIQPLLLDSETRLAFDLLVTRCRHAEALAGAADNAAGVRALLAGPSGTGKTLAARELARALGRDIWRVDFAAAVSKWIGETEKNLERAFSAAEEQDAVLLLDEGDALMARRTDVGSANDRYANLETSFLLQRIERFESVLVVTSNAFDRIDAAFTRRMDQVIRFSPPDEMARHAILVQHLGRHRIGDALLHEVAIRCALTGGQLRNVALAARVLGLEHGALPGDEALRDAVAQEYRKTSLPCPLKPLLVAVGG